MQGTPASESPVIGLGIASPPLGDGYLGMSLLQPNFSKMEVVHFPVEFVEIGFFSSTDTHTVIV